MNISSLFEYPAYLYNPKQIFIRLARQFSVPGDTETVCLPWGHRLSVNPREFIGHAIWQHGIHEINVCEAIARLVRPGETVMDIGANIGFVTSLLAKAVGPTGEVLAFEPHPQLNERLRANISGFGDATCGRVTADASALSDADGENWLVFDSENFARNSGTAGLRETSFAPGKESIKVHTRRIDSVVHDRVISLAKIDVEGAELCVLRGAERALAERRIKAILYEDFKSAESGIPEFLWGFGFSVFYLDGNLVRPKVHLVTNSFTPWRRGLDENFLAVLDPQALLKEYRRAGWRVFRL